MDFKTWRIVYTKPKMEHKVTEILTRRKLQTFCFLNRVVKQLAGKNKVSLQVLFPRTVFVKASEAEHASVKQLDEVLSYLHWLDSPVTITNDDIFILSNYLHEHSNINVERIPVDTNENFSIEATSSSIQRGEVMEVKKEYSKLYLPSLGYVLHSKVANAETISSFNFPNFKKLNSAV